MNPILIVMKKELKELFRDKRVRTNSVIMPGVMMMVFLALFNFMAGIGDKENQTVHVVKADNKIIQALKQNKVQVVEVADVAEGQRLIREGKATLVLRFDPNLDQKVAADEQTSIEAYYDPQQPRGMIALSSVSEAIDLQNKAAAATVLHSHGVSEDQLTPMKVVKKEVQVGKSNVNDFLIGLIPYLVVIYAFYGAFGSGSDTVAGEKEKMTLETLLIAPVRRSQIALGKFLALATICLCSSSSALLGVIIAGSSRSSVYSRLFEKGLGLNAGQIGMMILLLIPTVAFFASLLVAVSAYAKNTREAQSYMGLMSLVVIMPAMFGQFIGFTDLLSKWWIRLVPVLNTSITLRESLQGKSDNLGVALTIGIGAVLAVIGIRIAVHLFKREQVLTRI